MMRFIFSLVFFLGCVSIGNSQKSLSDYSFVSVPNNYDFLEGKDQYQLNSLTKHLFDQYGFNAYLNSELPDVRRCDGVWADVVADPGFIYITLSVILKDCEGNELYRTKEEKAKIKDYQRTYQLLLRNAFKQIRALGVIQSDIKVYGNNEKQDSNPKREELVIKERPSGSANVALENEKINSTIYFPKDKFIGYTMDNAIFLLKKTSHGYSLYQETQDAEEGLKLAGKLTVSNNDLYYKHSDGIVYPASFEKNGDLNIFEPENPMVFKKMR